MVGRLKYSNMVSRELYPYRERAKVFLSALTRFRNPLTEVAAVGLKKDALPESLSGTYLLRLLRHGVADRDGAYRLIAVVGHLPEQNLTVQKCITEHILVWIDLKRETLRRLTPSLNLSAEEIKYKCWVHDGDSATIANRLLSSGKITDVGVQLLLVNVIARSPTRQLFAEGLVWNRDLRLTPQVLEALSKLISTKPLEPAPSVA